MWRGNPPYPSYYRVRTREKKGNFKCAPPLAALSRSPILKAMKKLKYGDVRPMHGGKFTLRATGETIHEFRKLTLDDQEWMRSELGIEPGDLFSQTKKVSDESICRVLWRLIRDKEPFAPKEVEEFTETGKMLIQLSGPRVLMRMIDDGDEWSRMLYAYVEVVTNSRVTAAMLADQEKKTAKQAEKTGAHAGAASSMP